MIRGGEINKGTVLIIKNAPYLVVEREFGNGSFLEMYSGYVSKKIRELLELEKENNAEDSSE